MRVLEVGDETSSVYADLWADLRRAGTPVPTNDVWIAASAFLEGATVVTFDRPFEVIPRIGSIVLRP